MRRRIRESIYYMTLLLVMVSAPTESFVICILSAYAKETSIFVSMRKFFRVCRQVTALSHGN